MGVRLPPIDARVLVKRAVGCNFRNRQCGTFPVPCPSFMRFSFPLHCTLFGKALAGCSAVLGSSLSCCTVSADDYFTYSHCINTAETLHLLLFLGSCDGLRGPLFDRG